MLIITKEFNSLNVRIISSNQEWFIAKDIAELLGYSNTRKAITDHCKNSITLDELISKGNDSLRFDPVQNLGRNYKNIKLIPESDVWRLIIKSRLPEAEKIEKWIMEEVLPEIRKTGSYSLQNSQSPQTEENDPITK
jgi:prophage antirepressor-like protein